jgi:hypothetical protein
VQNALAKSLEYPENVSATLVADIPPKQASQDWGRSPIATNLSYRENVSATLVADIPLKQASQA